MAQNGEVEKRKSYEKQLQWNGDLTPAVEKFVHQLIETQAIENPTSQAICSWDGNLTYADLDNLSSRLANHLFTKGIVPETIVPLCFEKSLWTIVSLLGVLKAGGAFLMLDPSQPAGRLEAIVKQTGARFMLASRTCEESCRGFVEKVLVVDADTLVGLESSGYSSSVRLDNAAYYIFSSGSTGAPKGIISKYI